MSKSKAKFNGERGGHQRAERSAGGCSLEDDVELGGGGGRPTVEGTTAGRK